MKTRLAFLVAMVAGTILTVATAVYGGPSCAQARAEARAAQTTLSRATRDCDGNAVAYSTCLQRSRNNRRACVAQKRRLDVSLHRKRQATDAFRFARGRLRYACRAR